MKTQPTDTGYVADDLPDPWRTSLAALLSPGETVVSWLMLDLDPQLRFAAGVLVVTDRQLLAKGPGSHEWQMWLFEPGLALRHHDHAGVGTLELRNHAARLAVWRYTLEHNPAALQFIERFRHQRDLRQGIAPASLRAPESGPASTTTIHSPPSTWALLRL